MLPFLRWAGGKRQILRYLLASLPTDVSDRAYHEPFLGAGSLFFAVNPRKARLADINDHLIHCYKHIRACPKLISSYMHKHAKSHSKDHYYQQRNQYNLCIFYSAAQASRFIYLNKACFNGIFRVNLKGEFNVPYGYKKN